MENAALVPIDQQHDDMKGKVPRKRESLGPISLN